MAIALRRLSSSLRNPIKPYLNGGSLYYNMVSIVLFRAMA